ncbi:MAG: lyase family protein, partial [Thermomicrobiales bacterium]
MASHQRSLALVGAFDERVDSLVAPGAVGAGNIARAQQDLAATAQRLVLRDRVLALVAAMDATRAALLDLAEDHVFTLMPVWSGASPLQPTNFAHFLTGTIAPLSRAAQRLHTAYEELDRSSLGAGALSGPGLPVDRDETADLLGSEGPAASTFDALSAVDHLVAVGGATAAAVAPLRRLIEELLVWLRTDPQSIRLSDDLLATSDANLPHFRPPAALQRLVAAAHRVEDDAATIARLAHVVPYGPIGEQADAAVKLAMAALSRAATAHEAFAAMI